MADESIEDIKKLPLRERVAKLKDFEEKRKKELEQAAKLLKESIDEQRKQSIVEKIEVPQAQAIDITSLFKNSDEALDAVLAREAPKAADEDAVKYALQQVQFDYQILTKFDTELDSYKVQKAILKIEERVREIASKVGYESHISKDIADQLTASRNIIYTMKKRAGL